MSLGKRSTSMNTKNPKRKYIIPHESKFRMIWDLYIVALNVINIALIPLEVGLRPTVF